MRVLYLFTSYRGAAVRNVEKGEQAKHGFWGMFDLPKFGVEASLVEPEQYYPKWLSEMIRRWLGVYWLHVSVFLVFFRYDYVFTSTAFGTQLVHTLLHIRRPRWVMHDFSIMGLIGEEKTYKQRAMAYITEHAAGIVTLGIGEKEKLEKRFPHLRGRIEFIPFGVDLDFFRPMDVPQTRQILAAGFDPDRDWKTFFAAVEGLDIPVVVATRASRVAHIAIPRNVTIKLLTPRELAAEYARSMAAVVPLDTSKGVNDAMGCSALFEAMAAGKPVVATGTHTMTSYVTDGENGLLVPEGDTAAMRAAMERLLADEPLRQRLGSSARQYAEAHLDAEKLAGKLADFFKKIQSL
jgi:glycosyltransferase involved in cell wall biosynthesis